MGTESDAVARRSVRDWVVDLTFLSGILMLTLMMYLDSPELRSHGSPTLLILDLVTGAICAASLWWRRRWSTEIALVTAVASAFSQICGLAAVVMLFTVAIRRDTRTLVLVSAVNLAASCVLILTQPDPTVPLPLDLVLTVLIMAVVIAWGMFLRARRQLLASLKERAERAELEQHWRFDQGRQLERTRIAREMHDVLGHRISLISMHAGALELRAASADEEMAESAAIIRASAHQALQDLRAVIGVLRTEPDGQEVERPQPTLEDLPALVEESKRAGMNVTLQFQVPPTPEQAPTSVGRTAYRVVQEGLTNARKHAPGATVLVQVNGQPGPGLSVELRTRRPLRTELETETTRAGQGLLGLAERAELVGGRCEHSRTADGDFLLQCWLPWSAWRLPERH